MSFFKVSQVSKIFTNALIENNLHVSESKQVKPMSFKDQLKMRLPAQCHLLDKPFHTGPDKMSCLSPWISIDSGCFWKSGIHQLALLMYWWQDSDIVASKSRPMFDLLFSSPLHMIRLNMSWLKEGMKLPKLFQMRSKETMTTSFH